MVWPMRMRHRASKHAFEDALDEARLTPDDELEDFVEASASSSMSRPGVGSLGDIAVAAGYVGRVLLARVYGDDEETVDHRETERPGDAAKKLKAVLVAGGLSSGELRRMRRRFAAQYHPDRVAAEYRAEAVAAMAEVNAAIDRALNPAKKRT